MTAATSLLKADAVQIPLADATVDLIVTSPPYFALRSYTDGGEHYDGQIGSEATPDAFLQALWTVTTECWRVLKPTGNLWINLGDKYAGSNATNNNGTGSSTLVGTPSVRDRNQTRTQHITAPMRPKSLMGLPWRYAIGCIDGAAAPDGQQWILRAEIVWGKRNGLPEPVTDRVRRSHEQWFHLTKEGRYYSAIDEIREPYTSPPAQAQKSSATQAHQTSNPCIAIEHDLTHNPLGKLPGSVWSIASQPLHVPQHLGVDHYAAFPQELPHRIIKGWSPSGICTACGEGRRPLVQKDRSNVNYDISEQRANERVAATGGTVTGGTKRSTLGHQTETTNVGTQCDCWHTGQPNQPPTRPAVILDPFAGTGTTIMVANALGRHGIGLDLSTDYIKLAKWRTEESGHYQKHAQNAQQRQWKEHRVTIIKQRVEALEEYIRQNGLTVPQLPHDPGPRTKKRSRPQLPLQHKLEI